MRRMGYPISCSTPPATAPLTRTRCRGAGAARLEGAHLAMPAGEAGPHHPPPLTGVDRPALARITGRTGRNLSVPIELEVLKGEGARRSGLPLLVLGRWPDEHHTVVADAGHQVFRIHIPGIDQMRARQQILGGQGPMYLLEDVAVDNRRRRGLNVGDEMRPLRVTGFRHVHLV